MKKEIFPIGDIPSILWGNPSDKVYLCIHGQGGCKEEAEDFAGIAVQRGWQVLSIDLPEHGDRAGTEKKLLPWLVVPELQAVMGFAKSRWDSIALRAGSIGAWFSMLSYADERLERSLFVSPILDMHRLIRNMMQWSGVTEDRLGLERTIPTASGQTLSWEYLSYAKSNPIAKWNIPTEILYGDRDNLTEREVAESFAERFGCSLTIMENGEHWFHTPEQLKVLNEWTIGSFKRP